MSRLAAYFADLKRQGRKALIPYIVAGDPELAATLPAMHALVAAGADILEIGVPFSDPMADGPTITTGHERALMHHTGMHDVLEVIKAFRRTNTNTPIVLMGYLNPIEIMGYADFAKACGEAGVDGVLTVDLPPEEGEALNAELAARAIDPIYLIAPTTTMKRAQRILDAARGYVYYVSVKGVTGSSALDVADVKRRLDELRTLSQLPIGVGFGIKDAESAAAVAAHADGVVVGSVLVQKMGDLVGQISDIPAALSAIIGPMRHAIDQN